jgi:hypothetical protein
MAKLTNRGRNMGERIRNKTKISQLVYKLKYITQISRMKFLIRREECKPRLKIRQKSNLNAYRIDLSEVPNKH